MGGVRGMKSVIERMQEETVDMAMKRLEAMKDETD